MKNKFLILWMLSSVLLSACDEELTPYNVDTCWLGFDMENSADTLVYRAFITVMKWDWMVKTIRFAVNRSPGRWKSRIRRYSRCTSE